MKKLQGMQKSLSAIENKELEATAQHAIKGGRLAGDFSAVRSNFYDADGHQDIDVYDENGHWLWRDYV